MDKPTTSLNRVLNLPTGILLVAGTMIGSGAFKKIAPMSQLGLNEIHILLAWIIAGVITMFGAFVYSGLASMTTETGGVYEYLRLMFGNFFSFLFGWSIFTIGGSGSIAALAFIFSQSVSSIFHLPDPFHSLKDISIGNFIFPFADSGIKIFAVIVMCLLTWINCRGVKKGGILNNIVTAAKILGILILIVLGLFYSRPEQHNAAVANTGLSLSGAALFSALFAAMLSALWAYDGWANITYVTGEIKNPKRNVPIAVVAGVGIAMFLYTTLNYTFIKVLPLDQLAAIGQNKIAAAEVASVILGSIGSVLIASLIMICTFGALNACIITYPRVYYRMAQEGFFFKKVADVHPRFKTPNTSLVYSLVWSCVLVVTGTFDQLTNLVIFSGYLFFGLIAYGLIKMKRKGIITTKVIGYPFTPIVIILFSATLVINTIIVQPKESIIGILLILSGVPFYYQFKRKQQTLARNS
jgi:APA family basic amino acid/polyamine antiporter